MPAVMLGYNCGDVLNLVARSGGPAAEIHIFKPDGVKALIHAAQPIPNIAPEHEERASGLFHWARLVQVPV